MQREEKSEAPSGVVRLGGEDFDTLNIDKWDEQKIQRFQALSAQEEEKALKTAEAANESAMADAAVSKSGETDVLTVSELCAGLLTKGGLTSDEAAFMIRLLGKGVFKETYPRLAKALQALQHVPADTRLQEVSVVKINDMASIPPYVLDESLKRRANLVVQYELPSRAYKLAIEKLANRPYNVTPDYNDHSMKFTLTDGTVFKTYAGDFETNSNLRKVSGILSRLAGKPVEFFRTEVESSARYMLHLHPCQVRDGLITPYDAQQMEVYRRLMNQTFIETHSPATRYHKAHRVVHDMFIRKLVHAKAFPGVEANPLRHACMLLNLVGLTSEELDQIFESRETAEVSYVFRLPLQLGDAPEKLRSDIKDAKYTTQQLLELNPTKVLESLARSRNMRDPGKAAGIDKLAEPSTFPFSQYESQTATAYKIISLLIDNGLEKYLLENPKRVAIIGIDKGPELSYLSKYVHANKVCAFDLSPCMSYGYAVNYLDVLKREESLKALQGFGGLFFDVANKETGRNTDPNKMLQDCSYTRNAPLFASMAYLITEVRPDNFAMKTFLPPFPQVAGDVWPGFKELYKFYDLSFYKRGKMHNDEYTLYGRLRAKPLEDAEILAEGRKFFFCQWRAIGAITLAGNVIADFCVCTGKSRVSFVKKTHHSLLPGGAKGAVIPATTPFCEKKPLELSQVPAMKAAEAYLVQCDKWHQDRSMDMPYVSSNTVTDHRRTEHEVEAVGDFDF
jgi:hypothetical protein